ncbi:MAG: hypothetical protein WC889_11765 [Myxococcota bacterium]|jgi:hypothetical protein
MKLVLDVGGVPFGIEHENRSWDKLLRKVYAGFVSNARPVFWAKIDAQEEYLSGVTSMPESIASPVGNGDYNLLWYDFRGVFEPGRRLCTCEAKATEFSINGIYRLMLSNYITESGGLLVHSASFVRDGKAYLFPGVSTAGKTTLSQITLKERPGYEILSDEISCIRKVDGRWRAYGTPFWGDLKIAGRNISAPLEKICFINKAGEHGVADLDSMGAFSSLMQNAMVMIRRRDISESIMDLGQDATRSVKTVRLNFRKDAGFWDLI